MSEKNKEKNFEKEYIFFEICTSEIKISDLIGKLKTDKNKIDEWNDGIMIKVIKQGKYIVVDRINEAPSNISQRFNLLYDKTYMKNQFLKLVKKIKLIFILILVLFEFVI